MELELFAIGLFLSLAFAGWTGISAGGIIVPSYLVLYVDQPGRVVSTFAAAIIAFLVARVLSRYLLLFGKRQFVVVILCGALSMMLMSHLLPEVLPQTMEFKVLGWVIPGLIANAFQRQGLFITSAALVIVTVGAYFAGRLIVQFV